MTADDVEGQPQVESDEPASPWPTFSEAMRGDTTETHLGAFPTKALMPVAVPGPLW